MIKACGIVTAEILRKCYYYFACNIWASRKKKKPKQQNKLTPLFLFLGLANSWSPLSCWLPGNSWLPWQQQWCSRLGLARGCRLVVATGGHWGLLAQPWWQRQSSQELIGSDFCQEIEICCCGIHLIFWVVIVINAYCDYYKYILWYWFFANFRVGTLCVVFKI